MATESDREPGSNLVVRPVAGIADLAAVEALDRSITTEVIFDVRRGPHGFELRPLALSPPLVKRYPFSRRDEASWDSGLVAVLDDEVVGFVATRFNDWNSSVVVAHFYVSGLHRGRGFGRQLMEAALADGARRGARRAWVETSSLNYPGVAAYERLGFELVGLDLTLYDGTDAEGETALFLGRPIRSHHVD